MDWVIRWLVRPSASWIGHLLGKFAESLQFLIGLNENGDRIE